MYKLLALDLDGTLTNNKKEITPRTFDALMKAQEKGVRIVLASGRPTYGIVPLAKQLHIDQYGGYILAFNGGKITNWQTKQTEVETMLNPELVPELYDFAVKSDLAILTYRGDSVVTNKGEDKYVYHEAVEINKMPVVELKDFLCEIEYPINKCLIVGEPERVCALEQEMLPVLGDRMGIFRSAPFFLELVPQGIDKAESLNALINKIGVKREEIIACGDGYNDLSMIEFAGLGVAMANAVDEVKAKADHITLSNEEDGVAHVIEEFIL